MLYAINIPGKMYRALRERNALQNQNPTDEEAFAVFKAAEQQEAGTGHTYVVSGERRVLVYILDYIDSLHGLAVDGIVPAYEFGSSLQGLAKVSNQTPVPIP